MEMERSKSDALLRRRLLEFLIDSSQQLLVRPIVKYTAFSFFADRFFPSISSSRGFDDERSGGNFFWLLSPLTESNLQLFVLVSIWISSKLHDTRPLSVKSLKNLGDILINDQCFSTRDFAVGEEVFLWVIKFDISASRIAFIYLEELLLQLRELSKVGNLVNIEVCMEVMDLLYESEQISILFCSSPHALAASILVAAYFFLVPKQQWEFPLLPWVKFATTYEEADIGTLVHYILIHVLAAESTIF